jgi:alkanesulfonate monooxygenase SsuD/methylene tetrahydromethanopterin reductase-like flavin-dependent oxidoreductase (luciferase family)
MSSDVRVGVVALLSADQWTGAAPGQLVQYVRDIEDLGFDSLWANDSLVRPRIEALTFLAAAAPVTERLTLGTAALLPALRRPVQTAHVLASIDRLAQGRLTIAVGVGFPGMSEIEYAVSEVPWRRRSIRLDETVALWRQLWTGEGPRSFTGETLTFTDIPAVVTPFDSHGPRIWLAGDTAAVRSRAGALYDGWLPYPPAPETYAQGFEEVRQAAERLERSSDEITPALFVTVLFAQSAEAARHRLDEFATATYGFPLAAVEQIQAFAMGTPESVAATLRRYIDAGARHLVCRIGVTSLDDFHEQLLQLRDVRGALT